TRQSSEATRDSGDGDARASHDGLRLRGPPTDRRAHRPFLGAERVTPQSKHASEEDRAHTQGNSEEAKDNQKENPSMSKRYSLAILAYLVPTFALGFIWHLVVFKDYYELLAIYRADIIIPLGFASMLVQSVLFAWIYDGMFATAPSSMGALIFKYAVLGAMISWSFTTLAVGAKNIMSSVPRFMLIESAFTIVQWLMVAPLTSLAFRGGRRSAAAVSGVPTSR
ncbi:MAG TPA: hypothetical protein VGL34_00020, partial [Steroidobacteraceae bacterium]